MLGATTYNPQKTPEKVCWGVGGETPGYVYVDCVGAWRVNLDRVGGAWCHLKRSLDKLKRRQCAGGVIRKKKKKKDTPAVEIENVRHILTLALPTNRTFENQAFRFDKISSTNPCLLVLGATTRTVPRPKKCLGG